MINVNYLSVSIITLSDTDYVSIKHNRYSSFQSSRKKV